MTDSLGMPPENLNDTKRRGYLWNKLKPGFIINFLKAYDYPSDSTNIFSPVRIAEFIERQIPNRELTEWTLFIASKKQKVFKQHNVGELEVSCTQRTPTRTIENGIISLKGIRSSKDEFSYIKIDTEKQFIKEHKKFNENKLKKDQLNLLLNHFL